MVTASRDATARIWDVASGDQLAVLEGHKRWVSRVEFTARDSRIVTASDDGTVRLWDARSGAPEATLRPDSGPVLVLAVSPGGRRIFSGSRGGGSNSAVLWDARTGRALHRLPVETGFVTSAAFAGDGTRLAIGSSDGTVRVWEIPSVNWSRC